jgi:hypothetical protein
MALNDDYYDKTAHHAIKHQSAWRDRLPPEVEWDEAEVAELVDQIVDEHPSDD